jgi:hypothetical protein
MSACVNNKQTGVLSGIEAACQYIEHTAPEMLKIKFVIGQVNIRIQNQEFVHYDYDYGNSLLLWERFSQVVGRSSCLLTLTVSGLDILYASVHGLLRTFYDEMKHNTSLQTIHLCLPPGDDVPVFLSHFMQNNTNLKIVHLASSSKLHDVQSGVIASGLENKALDELDIVGCDFIEHASLDRIISSCWRVKSLAFRLHSTNPIDALTALLQNPISVLRKVIIITNIRLHNHLSTIFESMVGNCTLKEFVIRGFYAAPNADNSLSNLLCDSSTIETICNSNHTLEFVHLERGLLCSRDRDCLELNKNTNRNKVIQMKVGKYYMVGDFDIEPFASMHVSLLPEVMTLVQDNNQRHNAVFRLLRCIPELCTFAGRNESAADE